MAHDIQLGAARPVLSDDRSLPFTVAGLGDCEKITRRNRTSFSTLLDQRPRKSGCTAPEMRSWRPSASLLLEGQMWLGSIFNWRLAGPGDRPIRTFSCSRKCTCMRPTRNTTNASTVLPQNKCTRNSRAFRDRNHTTISRLVTIRYQTKNGLTRSLDRRVHPQRCQTRGVQRSDPHHCEWENSVHRSLQ